MLVMLFSFADISSQLRIVPHIWLKPARSKRVLLRGGRDGAGLQNFVTSRWVKTADVVIFLASTRLHPEHLR